MSVGLRIAERRRQLGLNQTELAQQAGLKPAAINQYESGERRPSFEALIKLAGALKVSTDYLIGSSNVSESLLNDPLVKTLLKSLECLTEQQKIKLLEFAHFLLNQDHEVIFPILNDVREYAELLLKESDQITLPVNVNEIAISLKLKMVEVPNLGYEGVLFRDKDSGIMLLDSKITDQNRKRFTIAHLLGHYIIPWHRKNGFYCRKLGTSTLKTDEIVEMEANNFAAALLMPKIHLDKDLLKRRPTLEQLEAIAHKKYHVSLFTLANRLIEYTVDKHALINSKNNTIEKTFQGSRPVVENLNPGTIAAEFFTNPPNEKTIRSGNVPASFWFLDANPNEEVYEESMYNPEYEAVLTLLTINSTILD